MVDVFQVEDHIFKIIILISVIQIISHELGHRMIGTLVKPYSIQFMIFCHILGLNNLIVSFTTPNNHRTYVSKCDGAVSCIAIPNLCSCIRPLGNRSCKHMRELQHLPGKKRSDHKSDYNQLKQLHSKSNEH